MSFVSLTEITINSVFHLPAFWFHASRSYRLCMASQGMMEARFNPIKMTYLTMTLWKDRKATLDFVAHPHHVQAMKWSKGKTSGLTYHYENAELPDWETARDLLRRLGKRV